MASGLVLYRPQAMSLTLRPPFEQRILEEGLRVILDMLAVIPTMKIGMMAAWNQTAGVSIHAELVGRGWVEQGHHLRVFSFIEKDYHGRSGVDPAF